jgi:branched-chain amino acid transport system substrate-binding protein
MILVAGVAGATAYVLLSGQNQPSDTIKIGLLTDLGGRSGKEEWQGAVLAAEQLNAEGGIFGRQVQVIGEDTDYESGADIAKITSALIRLLTYHKVDFVYSGMAGGEGITVQDMTVEHKTIMFSGAVTEEFTERVLEDYDRYKYFFRVAFNSTSVFQGITDSLLLLREQTGFNKVGAIAEDVWTKEIIEGLNAVLPQLGFEMVYIVTIPYGTADFTSYFAAAESAGVEIMLPLIDLTAVSFVKEYHERQSPMVIYGGYLGQGVLGPEGWEITDGKCEYISSAADALTAGYPLTSKTLSAREAYINRWNETPGIITSNTFDIVRYIIPDAVKRAGTLEAGAVIEALEDTSIEITSTRNFVFTSSHDVMMGENPNDPDADYMLIILFQWIDGKQVPVYPRRIMEEAGATYTYPDWPGPWDK